MFPQQQVAQQFNKAASTYDQAAIMQQEVGQRVIERLDFIRVKPNQILDLGAGSGYCTQLLRLRYPKATVHALDIANKSLALQHGSRVCADAHLLPFADNSVEFVFSNMMIHWCENIADVMLEVQRVLKPEGLFLFTTLGPDSLTELRQSWLEVDEHIRVHEYIDMHHVGDALLQSGFADPVMDSEMLTIEYERVATLLKDLKNLGVTNMATERQRGLLGKKKYQRFINAYEKFKEDDIYPVSYEVVYGHAWGKQLVQKNQEISIAVHEIKKR